MLTVDEVDVASPRVHGCQLGDCDVDGSVRADASIRGEREARGNDVDRAGDDGVVAIDQCAAGHERYGATGIADRPQGE